MSLHNFKLMYIQGKCNSAVDILSRQHERTKDAVTENRLFRDENKIAGIKKESLDDDLIREIHESDEFIHLGIRKMTQIFDSRGMKIGNSAISRVVKKCIVCQTYKHSTLKKQSFFKNFDIPNEIGNYIFTDICGPIRIPSTDFGMYLLVVVQRLSRFIWLSV
jgi:Integrase zinc binding domain